MCPGWLSFGFTKFDSIQKTLHEHPAKKLNFRLDGGLGGSFALGDNTE